MNKYLKRYTLKLTQEEIDNMSNPMYTTEFEFIILKTLPQRKPQDQMPLLLNSMEHMRKK